MLRPMVPNASPPDNTFHPVVEQPTLRRVVEHFTLFTLLLAVSLYAIGQFQTWKYIQAFGIPTTGLERGWETYVFTGAVAVINLLTSPRWSSLRWAIPLALFLISWAALNRTSRNTLAPRKVIKALLTLCVGGCYVLLLLMLGITWGLENASLVKASSNSSRVRYVVPPETETHLPKAFSEANGKGALRFVATGSDSLFLYDPATHQTFALPNRLILCRVYEPAP